MDEATGTAADRAEALFREGYSCSQAVFMTFAATAGLDPSTAARVASGFGGGMARHGWTCGALTGALMVIGLRLGSASATDAAAKDEAYARVRALIDRFRDAHGATECRHLIGCDLADPVERQAATDAGVFRTVCPQFVRTAAGLLAESLPPPVA